MFERSKEHVRDLSSRQEGSHLLKHWVTDHPELDEAPKFKFRIVNTFQDPLTRQVAEAVRISLRGDGILNSKTEYSRCRIPRLTIDTEGWKKFKKEEQEQEKLLEIQLEQERNENMLANEGRMDEYEKSSRRMEGKRKNECGNVRTKRMKLEPLVDWGNGSEVNGHQDENDLMDKWLGFSKRMNEKQTGWKTTSVLKKSAKLIQLELSFKKLSQDGQEDDNIPGGWKNLKSSVDEDVHGQKDESGQDEVDITIVETGAVRHLEKCIEVTAVADHVNEVDTTIDESRALEHPEESTEVTVEKVNEVVTIESNTPKYVRKRGKITKKEAKELKKNTRSVSDWMRIAKVMDEAKDEDVESETADLWMNEDNSFDEWVGMMFQEAIPENNVPLVQEPVVRVECGENSVNSSEGASTDNVVSFGLATSGLDGSDGMADMDLDLAVQELDRVKCTDVLIEKPRHGYFDQPKVEAIQVG